MKNEEIPPLFILTSSFALRTSSFDSSDAAAPDRSLHLSQPNASSRRAEHQARTAAVDFPGQIAFALFAQDGDGKIGLHVAAGGVRVYVHCHIAGDGDGDSAAGSG